MTNVATPIGVTALLSAAAMLAACAGRGEDAPDMSLVSPTGVEVALDAREISPSEAKFCLRTRLVGAAKARETCRTFDGWMSRGIDPRGK